MDNEKISLLEQKLVSQEMEKYIKTVNDTLLILRGQLKFANNLTTEQKQDLAVWLEHLVGYSHGIVNVNFPSKKNIPEAVHIYCREQAITGFLKKFENMQETMEYLEGEIENK